METLGPLYAAKFVQHMWRNQFLKKRKQSRAVRFKVSCLLKWACNFDFLNQPLYRCICAVLVAVYFYIHLDQFESCKHVQHFVCLLKIMV